MTKLIPFKSILTVAFVSFFSNHVYANSSQPFWGRPGMYMPPEGIITNPTQAAKAEREAWEEKQKLKKEKKAAKKRKKEEKERLRKERKEAKVEKKKVKEENPPPVCACKSKK